MILALEFAGALGILVPFVLLQLRRTSPHGLSYLLFNLVGSALLTAVAVVQQQWGFVILQAVWCLVAGWGLVRRGRHRAGWPQPDAAQDRSGQV